MIQIELPKAEQREYGSSQITFRIVDQVDIDILAKIYDRYAMNLKAGDLLMILEPDGYEEIAEFYVRRHNLNERIKWGTNQELAELFEHLFANSEWEWIPSDDANDISNGQHMFVDDYGDVRVLSGWWHDENGWRDDPIEKLFTQGYIVYTFHSQDEYGHESFFHLPQEAIDLWKANDYGAFRDLVETLPPVPRPNYA